MGRLWYSSLMPGVTLLHSWLQQLTSTLAAAANFHHSMEGLHEGCRAHAYLPCALELLHE